MKQRMLAGAVLAGALLLTACAEEPAPVFTPPPVPEFAPPALTDAQASAVLEQVEQVVAEADAATDASLLEPRVAEAAAAFRGTEYALQSATEGSWTPQEIWTDSDIFVVTATDTWPRSVLAVSNPTAGTTVRLYLGLVQDGPRDPYRLVAWSRMLPGVETPTFVDPEIGSAPVTADQSGLRVTPVAALDQLAAIFTDPAGDAAADWGEDPFREFLATELEGLRTGVEVAGEVSTTTTAGEVIFGIGTAEGGAVVMGTAQTVLTLRKTIEGAELTLAGEMAALGGEEAVEAAANAVYDEMVTLYIPPEGSDAPLQLLGVERVLASVDRVE